MARVGYEFESQTTKGEAVLSGPVTDDTGMRLVVSGDHMWGGYVRNNAPAATYTATDAATLTSTTYDVPAPNKRNLPADKSGLARFTTVYRPSELFEATLKASVDHHLSGGTSWNDSL